MKLLDVMLLLTVTFLTNLIFFNKKMGKSKIQAMLLSNT